MAPRIKNIYLTGFLVWLFSFPLGAQEEYNNYIREFPQEFTLRPYIYRKFTSVSTERRWEEGKEARNFYPNTPVELGFGVTYKNYALNLAYAPPVFRDKENGKTKYIDFQYHYYHRKYLFDFYYQNYRGFYNREAEPAALFPDVHVRQYGVTGDYVFNNSRFSYRAAFYCNEKQVRSAGSFQVGGGFYYNKLDTDTTRILEGKNSFSNYQFSVTGGYIHTWVFKQDFFITVGVSTGVNFSFERLPESRHNFEVTPTVYPRVSGGV